MSAYTCIEAINSLINYKPSTAGPPMVADLLNLVAQIPGLSRFRVEIPIYEELNAAQKAWLVDIRDTISEIEKNRLRLLEAQPRDIDGEEAYAQDVQNLITKIGEYRDTTASNLPKLMLDWIPYLKEDLRHLKDAFLEGAWADPDLQKKHTTLEQSPFLIHRIIQGKMGEVGLSPGYCYGLTLSMVDSELSPYAKKERRVTIDKAIYDYQVNQMDRSKDQQKIKKERLIRLHFCPSIREQAEKLYQMASDHKGHDLMVNLSSVIGVVSGHATYLSLQANGKIRYMEPNYGAFLFNTKEEFIAAYRMMYHGDRIFTPQFYEVSRLVKDSNLTQSESLTWRGKIRSLLTGPKYSDNIPPMVIASAVAYGLVGGLAGAFAGAAIGSVIPIVGTVMGAIMGGILGAVLGGMATIATWRQGYTGLMGNWHYLRVQAHRFSEWCRAKLGMKRECDETPELVISEETKEQGVMPESNQHSSDSPVIISQALGCRHSHNKVTPNYGSIASVGSETVLPTSAPRTEDDIGEPKEQREGRRPGGL